MNRDGQDSSILFFFEVVCSCEISTKDIFRFSKFNCMDLMEIDGSITESHRPSFKPGCGEGCSNAGPLSLLRLSNFLKSLDAEVSDTSYELEPLPAGMLCPLRRGDSIP